MRKERVTIIRSSMRISMPGCPPQHVEHAKEERAHGEQTANHAGSIGNGAADPASGFPAACRISIDLIWITRAHDASLKQLRPRT